MKKNSKLLGCTLIMCLAMIACDELNFNDASDPDDPSKEKPEDDTSTNDSLKLGENYIYPLHGSLTTLENENFVNNERTFYCFLLKVEKFYPGEVIFPNGSKATTGLSYSINFKLFSELKDGPVNETWSVVMPADLVSYYEPLDQSYAADHKALAYLSGSRSFDDNLDANEYIDYLKSQVRIKSGTILIKKFYENFLISFQGETETGEKVSLHFNDRMSMVVDNKLESQESDFSTTEIPENYILKAGKYYTLDDGYYYVFTPYSYEGKSIQTVRLIARREYYRYEYDQYYGQPMAGVINKRWKSSTVVLQFQFESFYYFRSITYKVAPSKGIYSIGYDDSNYESAPFEGFPNDSLFIGYYHLAQDMPHTHNYDEFPTYMENQLAIQSGQLTATELSSEHYEFQGDFIDAKGDEVKVKFKASNGTTEFAW